MLAFLFIHANSGSSSLYSEVRAQFGGFVVTRELRSYHSSYGRHLRRNNSQQSQHPSKNSASGLTHIQEFRFDPYIKPKGKKSKTDKKRQLAARNFCEVLTN